MWRGIGGGEGDTVFPSLCGLEFVKVTEFRKLGGVGQRGGNMFSSLCGLEFQWGLHSRGRVSW